MKKYENFELKIIYLDEASIDCLTGSKGQDTDGEFWGGDIFDPIIVG